MKPITEREKEDLVDWLITMAYMHGSGRTGPIGKHTMKLKGRDREVMESLTAKDFYHRIP